MKLKNKILILIAAFALAFALPADAQQYGAIKTLLSISTTNANNTATNVGNIGGANANYVTLTKKGDFVLEVQALFTNAVTGTIDVNYTTSADGSNWATTGAGTGTFSVPCTNSGTALYWTTNITVNALGYWKATWVSNATGLSTTSLVVKAWGKPERFK